MMTKNKKSLSLVLALSITVLLALGIFISCQNTNQADPSLTEEILPSPDDPGVEYPVPENCRWDIDNIRLAKEGGKPYEGWFDTEGKGDPVTFGGAAFYYLPKDIKHYEYYRKLLKGDGKSKYNILKYLVGHYDAEIDAYPIIKLEIPTKAERERRIKAYEPRDISQTRATTTMPLSRARQFFDEFTSWSCSVRPQCPCIPFQYAADGCYARAHYMRKLMLDAGYDCEKIFISATSGYLQAETKAGCCQRWGWHVAPLVATPSGKYVMDPSLFDDPVSIATWVNKMKTTCAGKEYPVTNYWITPSYVYGPDWSRDDDYSDTYSKMEKYSMRSGCDNR